MSNRDTSEADTFEEKEPPPAGCASCAGLVLAGWALAPQLEAQKAQDVFFYIL